jgi:hypothetical protein
MSIAPIFKWASWWISDDNFTGIPNSFQSNYNIDIFTNPKSITLSKALEKDSTTVITEIINCFLKVSNWDILAFWNSWWVYRKTAWIWYKNSTTVTGAILSAVEYNWNFYFTTSASLYKFAVASISNTMTFSLYKTITASNYHPFVIKMNILHIWCNTAIDTETASWIYTVGEFTSNNLWQIKYLFTWSWAIKIYIYYPTFNKFELWYRDWTSAQPTENIPLIWLNIEQIINKQGNDYVISNWEFWPINWYNVSKVKQLSDYSTNQDSIASLWNKVFFWWIGWVYEWGSLNKNYPDVLSLSYWTSNSETDTVWAIFIDWTDLYVSWSNWATFWIDKLSTTTYASTWSLTTRVFYSEAKFLEKTSLAIRNSFAKLSWTDSIKIYYRYNISWSFVLHRTITTALATNNDFIDTIPLIWKWNFIELKFELTSWDGTTSPELYEDYLFYDSEKIWQ